MGNQAEAGRIEACGENGRILSCFAEIEQNYQFKFKKWRLRFVRVKIVRKAIGLHGVSA